MTKWVSAIWKRLLKSKALTRYLIITNVVSGAVADASGDWVVQRVIERSSTTYDYARTCRMAAVGVSLTVPDHYWYVLLDRKLPRRTAKTISLKVLLDCSIMGPVNIVLFYLGEEAREEGLRGILIKFDLRYSSFAPHARDHFRIIKYFHCWRLQNCHLTHLLCQGCAVWTCMYHYQLHNDNRSTSTQPPFVC